MCPRWRDGSFQEVIHAEYVLLEVNGLFTYTYSLTARTALCTSQPQNWSSIVKAGGHMGSYTWNREVAVSPRLFPKQVNTTQMVTVDSTQCVCVCVCGASQSVWNTREGWGKPYKPQTFFSHGPGGLNFKVKAPADLMMSGESPHPGSLVTIFLLCPHMTEGAEDPLGPLL